MDAVFLVLDSQLLRDSIRRLLIENGFSVLVDVADPESLLKSCCLPRSSEPDVVLIDGEYCGRDECYIENIAVKFSGSRIVVLTDDGVIDRITNKEMDIVAGILTFGIGLEVMLQALRVIQSGERVVQLCLAEPLFERLGRVGVSAVDQNNNDTGSSETGSRLPSAREAQILGYLLEGYSNKRIAQALGVAEATVKVHLKSLLRKIRAANRTQAAIWAMNHGYGTGGGGVDRQAACSLPTVSPVAGLSSAR